MDFRTLQYFVTAAREQNFTRAAEKLGMSQPPLSNQIKALEEDLGVQLFVRGKRRVQLTEAGELLLRRAGQILALCDKTREEIEIMGNGLSGRITLGMVEGRAPYMAARWIAGFRKKFPRVRFDLWNGSGDDVLDQLARGLVDIAVIAAPYDREHLAGVTIANDYWTAMIPREHPLAARPGNEIPLRELAGWPLAVPSRPSRRAAIERWFADIGCEPAIVCTLSNYVDAVALAEQNACISIFPQTSFTGNEHVVSKIITEPAKFAQYVLVWNKEQSPAGIVRTFADYVKEAAREENPAPETETGQPTGEQVPGRTHGAELL
ncbi:LysR family transcriptional regulator [Lachnoclostridium sp. Marseille-P6806]|uniref:LysR family transcriptional regulator n=1 Tax=Lachnoclostridium sp. Marseille-P6806 TaxID=2364793 RepID=UPI00103000B2|nr:LysR family transcriptional regulator [Lachnoclostridium sp. Marseille-P6806]